MKEASVYRGILKQAWEITRRNKKLWVLGFLAIFWGNIGAYNIFDRSFGFLTAPTYPVSPGSLELAPVLKSATPLAIASGIVMTLLILSVLFILLWFMTVGRGGLIEAIAKRSDNKKVTVAAAITKGAKFFWPLLGIGLLSRLDVPLYVFLLAPAVRRTALGDGEGTGFFVLIFLAITLASLILSFLGIYASASVVLQGEKFLAAIKKSLQLFSRFWLVSIELALILYLVTLVLGIALIVAGLILGIPLLLLYVIVMLLQIPAGIWIVLVPAAVVYIALLIIVGSAFATFHMSAWTLLFMRLSREGAVAKVVRLTSRFAHVLHRKVI
ncbi:MAG: hypothetical protein UX17_C0024G0006 [Parcubacteria group bacterium GW2011_GWC2_45_7]|nr:MAG: hypothetical protein UX17_C0024G0006 [Parcubacteria group bacterium GW2011_GWC2_45_7]KKU73442.1 MAG: hypothetical protein UX98_C0007G0018 [Parcubacteria group bacterium GW2011_GWA2_47_26]